MFPLVEELMMMFPLIEESQGEVPSNLWVCPFLVLLSQCNAATFERFGLKDGTVPTTLRRADVHLQHISGALLA